MRINFNNTVIGKLWDIIWKDVIRVDRFQYYILLFFMLVIPSALYFYGKYWFTTSIAEHLDVVHEVQTRKHDSSECGFSWVRFLPFLFLSFAQLAVIVTFIAELPGMLRNFFNPEYETLTRFKKELRTKMENRK